MSIKEEAREYLARQCGYEFEADKIIEQLLAELEDKKERLGWFKAKSDSLAGELQARDEVIELVEKYFSVLNLCNQDTEPQGQAEIVARIRNIENLNPQESRMKGDE
jgi:hypothetical protein